jgi:hypothetical protein
MGRAESGLTRLQVVETRSAYVGRGADGEAALDRRHEQCPQWAICLGNDGGLLRGQSRGKARRLGKDGWQLRTLRGERGEPGEVCACVPSADHLRKRRRRWEER